MASGNRRRQATWGPEGPRVEDSRHTGVYQYRVQGWLEDQEGCLLEDEIHQMRLSEARRESSERVSTRIWKNRQTKQRDNTQNSSLHVGYTVVQRKINDFIVSSESDLRVTVPICMDIKTQTPRVW